MNASRWFYQAPEPVPYLIGERINRTFWQARIVEVYWTCDRAEAPFHAHGYLNGQLLEMEWIPNVYLALKGPAEIDLTQLVTVMSRRVLARPASVAYIDGEGSQVFEWHAESGRQRWSELQGRPGYSHLRRLNRQPA